jgi:hypothetical protein
MEYFVALEAKDDPALITIQLLLSFIVISESAYKSEWAIIGLYFLLHKFNYSCYTILFLLFFHELLYFCAFQWSLPINRLHTASFKVEGMI